MLLADSLGNISAFRQALSCSMRMNLSAAPFRTWGIVSHLFPSAAGLPFRSHHIARTMPPRSCSASCRILLADSVRSPCSISFLNQFKFNIYLNIPALLFHKPLVFVLYENQSIYQTLLDHHIFHQAYLLLRQVDLATNHL